MEVPVTEFPEESDVVKVEISAVAVTVNGPFVVRSERVDCDWADSVFSNSPEYVFPRVLQVTELEEVKVNADVRA